MMQERRAILTVIIPSFELRRSRLTLEIYSYNKVRGSWNFTQNTMDENERKYTEWEVR